MTTDNDVEILLVEDNPHDAELTHAGAQEAQPGQPSRVGQGRRGGARLPLRRGHGRAAVELTHAPKVILLDLKLPKVDGLEVLRRLKARRTDTRRSRWWC